MEDKMRKVVQFFYQFARTLNDVTTFLSFNPVKILRRIKNKILGRKLVRKVWKFPF